MSDHVTTTQRLSETPTLLNEGEIIVYEMCIDGAVDTEDIAQCIGTCDSPVQRNDGTAIIRELINFDKLIFPIGFIKVDTQGNITTQVLDPNNPNLNQPTCQPGEMMQIILPSIGGATFNFFELWDGRGFMSETEIEGKVYGELTLKELAEDDLPHGFNEVREVLRATITTLARHRLNEN